MVRDLKSMVPEPRVFCLLFPRAFSHSGEGQLIQVSMIFHREIAFIFGTQPFRYFQIHDLLG